MRAFLLLFVAAGAIGSAACSTIVNGTAEPEPVTQPVVQPLACAPRDATVCDGLERTGPDSPPREGSLAWAQVVTGATAEGRAGGTPKVALYEDGTLRRTSFVRNLTFFLTPPRGLAVATVEPSSVERIRADVAALRAADLQAFFGPEQQLTRDATGTVDLVRVPGGSACFLTARDDAHSACASDAARRLSDDLGALASAAEVKWRDAQTGTVSIGLAEVSVRGDWPLADDRAVEGSITFTQAEWRQIGQTGVYRLRDGSYIEIDLPTKENGVEGGNVSVYATRRSVVSLDDDLADLRADLVANSGRYDLTRGAWLGVPLSADRFPRFKNHDYAIVPASGTARASLRTLYAIETLDLRGEGPIALP